MMMILECLLLLYMNSHAHEKQLSVGNILYFCFRIPPKKWIHSFMMAGTTRKYITGVFFFLPEHYHQRYNLMERKWTCFPPKNWLKLCFASTKAF